MQYYLIYPQSTENYLIEISNDGIKIVVLNKEIEQKLKDITKLIIIKIKKNDDTENKGFELRKKIFNNIKLMLFDKKDIKLE